MQSKVVTGTTGALGANILDTLSKDPSILKIVCLVRAKDNDEARRRVAESLLNRKKPPLSDGSRIICVPVRLSQANLGLSSEMLDFLRDEATHFIHVRWSL
jgi:thioester reductase-like protein